MKTTVFTLFLFVTWLLLCSVGICADKRSSVAAPKIQHLETGYCCLSGKINNSSRVNCLRNKGAFYTSQADAEKDCLLVPASRTGLRTLEKTKMKGFCCIEGNVKDSTEKSCRKEKGRFAQTRKEAERICDRIEGFCCNKGEITKSTLATCKKMAGTFSTDKLGITRKCGATKGFCCDEGKVLTASISLCDKRDGIFTFSKAEASRLCKKAALKPPPGRISSPRYEPPFNRTDRSRTKLTLLPDLEITKTWLNHSCEMQVDIRNNGGPISDKHFKAARIHMSAGPGNVIAERKKYLKVADPAGNLKNPGGSVTFNTQLVIHGSTATLSWVDTEHNIKESSETNNGDDATLYCKKKVMQINTQQKDVIRPKLPTSPNQPPPPPPNPGGGAVLEMEDSVISQFAGKAGIADQLMTPKEMQAHLESLSFRVVQVIFREDTYQGQKHLTFLIEFNHRVDESSINGVNFRLLKEISDNPGFWNNAYPSSAMVMRVQDRYIAAGSLSPLTDGNYKVHLRGTIKNDKGAFLDCDADGTPEGGYLPPYESSTYTYNSSEGILTGIEDFEGLIETIRGAMEGQ